MCDEEPLNSLKLLTHGKTGEKRSFRFIWKRS